LASITLWSQGELMRIGIVTGEYPPMQGGVGAFSQIIAHKFVEQGHDVFVYSGEQAQSDDARIPMTHHQGKWGFNSLSAIKRWAEQNRLDVINIQFQTAAFGMSPFIHFLPNYIRSIPVVTTFHDLRFPYLFPKAGKLRDWIVMHLARASAGTIVTNHEDYERVKHLPKATMIPIGSNILTAVPSDLMRWERERAITEYDGFWLSFFGFMNRSKGVETLLDAFAKVREKHPFKLIFIGGRTGTSDPTNAAYADEIEHRIEKLGLKPYVFWTGFVTDEDVSAYLTLSSVVALPFLDGASFRRGTLMAAIHHSCAIVTTTPQVPIPEFVDGENMTLVPPNDSDELAQGILGTAGSSRLKTGALVLRDKFDWNNIARDTVAFFERVIHA
jgi:glycosyltransferase involved in cell wall biosynthesis